MAIPETIINEIQAKTDIVEVISSRIPLKKAGRNYKGNCPFHHEKTPSFIVSPDKQIYHCFGCGAGGNVFSFLMKYEKVEFPEAIEMLAEKLGVKLPRDSRQSAEMASLASQLYKINEIASQFFQVSLTGNARAREYLSSRGVGEEAIKNLKIGYAPDGWELLLNFFKKKGVDAKLLEKAGLAIANDRGGHYDRFRNRIVFPIIDLKGKVLGFGARVLDASLPKYMNSPETPIYSKGKNLYGLNYTKEEIRKEGHALIVEGYLDFIVPYQAGIKNLIATLGTALTLDQVKMLKRFANTAVIVYDPDAAGEAASIRGLDLFITEDVNVYIAELPGGLDPDSYIRKYGAEEFRALIKSSKNLFDYKFDKLASRVDSSSMYGKMKIAGEMLATLAKINNAILKSSLVKKLSEKLGVDEEALRVELKKVKADFTPRQYPKARENAPGGSNFVGAEKMMLALLFDKDGGYITRAKEQLRLEEFKSSSVRDIVEAIFNIHKSGEEVSAARLISMLGSEGEYAMLISEAADIPETKEMTADDKEKAFLDCVMRIKKDNMKDQLVRMQDAIKMAYSAKEEAEVKRLMTEYDNLVRSSKP